jgi:hypothetical protein
MSKSFFHNPGPHGKVQLFGITPLRVFDRNRDPGTSPKTPMSKQSSKTTSLRRDQFLASWLEFAPTASFAGFTLAQFEEESKKPLTVRSQMIAARTQLNGMKIERDKVDMASNEIFVSVANAIRGDKDHGLNSSLYRSLGFVTQSERKRAKRRPSEPGGTVADANAA